MVRRNSASYYGPHQISISCLSTFLSSLKIVCSVKVPHMIDSVDPAYGVTIIHFLGKVLYIFHRCEVGPYKSKEDPQKLCSAVAAILKIKMTASSQMGFFVYSPICLKLDTYVKTNFKMFSLVRFFPHFA